MSHQQQPCLLRRAFADAAPALSSRELRQLLQLRRTYLSADGMLASLHQQRVVQEEGEQQRPARQEEVWQRMQVR